MKRSERGFTLIELLVVVAILSLMVGAVSMSIFQVVYGTERSNNNMTVIRQVQNAGDWISRDAVSAQSIVTGDELTPPDFLILEWREGVYEEVPISHSVTYSFEDLSADGIGKLKRTHTSSDAPITTTLVAEYIDSDNTTASYERPVLTVTIASELGEANEVKEYRVWQRSSY